MRRLFVIQFPVFVLAVIWNSIFFLNIATAQLTPSDVANLVQVNGVKLHPMGSHVAYSVTRPRSSDDSIGRDYRELWVMDLETGKETKIVTAPQSVLDIHWIPGTYRIAFRMTDENHHEKPQVYSVDIYEDDLKMHTNASEGVIRYAFSSDPSVIAYTMRQPLTQEVLDRHNQGFDMEVAGENERYVRLWIQENGEASVITPENISVWDFEWSPDDLELAVRVTYGTGIDYEMMFSEILRLDLANNNHLELLVESQGKVGPMAWSPEGDYFAYLGARSFDDPLPQRVYVSEVGQYNAMDITPDDYEGTPEWLEWKDNEILRFVSVEGTRTALRELPVTGGEAVLRIGGDLENFRSVSFDASGQRIAAPVHRRNHPTELYLVEMPEQEWTRLTFHNKFLENRTLGRQETIEWQGPDGLRIQGVITYPVNYEEGEVYPLAVLPHGGPEGVSIDGWNTRPLYPVQVLATEGYVVLKPNYRGSAGRGSAFTMANHRDLGGREFEDVLYGVDYLTYNGVIDPERVGISGTSYGGYFSAWAGTRHSDRFAAAVTFAGLSNWISFMGTTDIPHEMSMTHWNLWWFENQGLNWDRSPVAQLHNARTPILVAHGMEDERVHPEQSIQLHQFLKLNDIPTEFVMYPREPHGLTERAHRIDFMERVVDWFALHVKNRR